MARRNLLFGGSVPLEPGERDRVVTIEQRVSADSVDAAGFPTDNGEGWTPLTRREYMRKQDLRGNERFQAAQLSAPFDTVWEMAYRPDMDPDLVDIAKLRRLVYQGRTYDIVSGSQIGRREGIELMTLARMG